MNKPVTVRQLTKFLPFAIAVILLFFVYRKIDFPSWIEDLRQINPIWIFLLIVLGLIQSLIATISWKLSLSVLDIRVKTFKLFLFYLVGGFVSYVLPGTIGGDAAKLLIIGKDDKKYKESMVSLVMQRVVGIIVAITIFFIPVTIFTDLISNKQLKILILIVSFLVVISLLLLIFLANVSSLILKLSSKIKFSHLNKLITDLTNIFSIYRKYPKQLLLMALASFLFNLTSLFLRYIIMLSLGITIDFFNFINIVIFVTVIVQVPVSIAGLGIREGSYVYFYSLVGVNKEKALAFSILEYIPGLLVTLCATIIFLFTNTKIFVTKDAKNL